MLGEVVIFLFLIVALSRRALPGAVMVDRRTPFHEDPEVQMAAFFLIGVPVMLFLRHWVGAIEADEVQNLAAAGARALGGAVHHHVLPDDHGFESADWSAARSWSGLGTPGLILLGLAMVGGGVATAAGGVKLLRVYALFRHAERELERIVHPSSIGGSGPQARRLRREGAYLAWIFFMLFAFSIAIVTAALALVGLNFETAMVLTIAALTTTGQLAGMAAETPIRWTDLGMAAKIILAPPWFWAGWRLWPFWRFLAPDSWRK
jgi:trk system potassium uptake protein TrkH